MPLISEDLVLQNDHVNLRRLSSGDFENLVTFAINEPELWRFSLTSAAGKDGMAMYLNQALKDFEAGISYPFIVYDKEKKSYAGSTRFYDIQPAQNSLQLGFIWYVKEFHGTGLNKNCKYLLLEYAFETLGFDRVEFRADAENKRSVAAMKSIGYTPEGILRSHLVKNSGGRRNSIVLSILKDEWFGGIKQKIASQIKNLL